MEAINIIFTLLVYPVLSLMKSFLGQSVIKHKIDIYIKLFSCNAQAVEDQFQISSLPEIEKLLSVQAWAALTEKLETYTMRNSVCSGFCVEDRFSDENRAREASVHTGLGF